MDFTKPDLQLLRASDQLSCDLNGEIAILSLGTKLYFGLTEVGATIWQALETPQDFQSIVAIVSTEYDVSPDQCRADVSAFLQALHERGLLSVVAEAK